MATTPDKSASQDLSFDAATSLRDELDDGLIASMLPYMGDCDLMANRIEAYIAEHEAEYDGVEASLRKIPWAMQELPPDKLQRRLEKARDTLKKLTPAMMTCGLHPRVRGAMKFFLRADG